MFPGLKRQNCAKFRVVRCYHVANPLLLLELRKHCTPRLYMRVRYGQADLPIQEQYHCHCPLYMNNLVLDPQEHLKSHMKNIRHLHPMCLNAILCTHLFRSFRTFHYHLLYLGSMIELVHERCLLLDTHAHIFYHLLPLDYRKLTVISCL